MIKVTDMKQTSQHDNAYTVALFADAKSEVIPGAKIVGFPEGAKIEMGSTCLTAAGDFAFMKSDGTWSWM